MSLSAVCHCGASFSVPDNLLGKTLRCPRCKGNFIAGSVPQIQAAPRRHSKVRPAVPVAIPTGIPVPPRRREKASGISGAVIGGSIVAAVFALILVGGIALVLHLRSGRISPEPPADSGIAEQRPPSTEPAPNPGPTSKEPPPKDPPPRDPPRVTVSDGSLAPEVLQRVKKATVYLRVTIDAQNVAQGSGFFAVEPGVVLTNAHVLGMLVGRTRRPQKIEVVLNSGQTDERTLAATVLEVDRTTDLAVLRVTGPNLPEPLAVHEAKNLQETQQVFVCGFPYGTTLGKEVSVRKSSVASLRRENNALTRIQLEGGMDRGNSGGPVIDSRGNVVGVAVAGILGTTINFAIPGERVHAILDGRVSRMSLGQPYKDGTQAKLSVTLQVVDPLGRIRQVGVDLWTGNPGEPRPGSTTPPAALANDSSRQQTMLTLKDGEATGELVLPALPAGKAYWLQPVMLTGGKQSQWSRGLVFPEMAPPLERRGATLALAHKAGSNQPVEVACLTTIRRDRGGTDQTLVIDLDGQLAENIRSVDNQGTAAIRLDYLKMNMDITMDGKQSASIPRVQQLMQSINQLTGDLRVDRQGNILQNRLDMSKVPKQAQDDFTNIGSQIQQTLEALSIPLPGKLVTPGQSWDAQRALPIDTAGRYESGVMDMKYTFLGVRSRNGRDEAVISLSGEVRPRQGVKTYIKGRTSGTAVVDLSTGLVTSAMATVDVDLDLDLTGQMSKADGALEMKLQRSLPAGK